MPTAKGKSRERGKRVEREAVHFLRWCGFEARRMQQHSGQAGHGDVDCPSLPHLEVKGDERIDLNTADLDHAIEQAASDSPNDEWLLLWKRKGRGWRLTWIDGFWGVPLTASGDERIRQVLIKMAEQ